MSKVSNNKRILVIDGLTAKTMTEIGFFKKNLGIEPTMTTEEVENLVEEMGIKVISGEIAIDHLGLIHPALLVGVSINSKKKDMVHVSVLTQLVPLREKMEIEVPSYNIGANDSVLNSIILASSTKTSGRNEAINKIIQEIAGTPSVEAKKATEAIAARMLEEDLTDAFFPAYAKQFVAPETYYGSFTVANGITSLKKVIEAGVCSIRVKDSNTILFTKGSELYTMPVNKMGEEKWTSYAMIVPKNNPLGSKIYSLSRCRNNHIVAALENNTIVNINLTTGLVSTLSVRARSVFPGVSDNIAIFSPNKVTLTPEKQFSAAA